MAYFAPYIDETGLHIPTYQDILSDMIDGARTIFGADLYLENDSADYQILSIFALKTYDTLQGIAMAYNSRSPETAVGVGLDEVVKLNGIARKAGTHSTADIAITGSPYTQIVRGSVKDVNGVIWNLPENVSIPSSGQTVVTVRCAEPGPVAAATGEISKINTPTYGWATAVNRGPAVPGMNTESDEELRTRQTRSVAGPSQTMLAGTYAGIAAVDGVQRLAVYENDTSSAAVNPVTNPYGLPAHSVTCIVEGGDAREIAETILNHKGLGVYTNGDISISIEDVGGYANTIRFSRPVDVPIYVEIRLIPLSGYIPTMADEVKSAVYAYLSGFEISADIPLSILTGIVVNVNKDPKHPAFSVSSIKIGRSSGALVATDIALDYNEVVKITLGNITVEV